MNRNAEERMRYKGFQRAVGTWVRRGVGLLAVRAVLILRIILAPHILGVFLSTHCCSTEGPVRRLVVGDGDGGRSKQARAGFRPWL